MYVLVNPTIFCYILESNYIARTNGLIILQPSPNVNQNLAIQVAITFKATLISIMLQARVTKRVNISLSVPRSVDTDTVLGKVYRPALPTAQHAGSKCTIMYRLPNPRGTDCIWTPMIHSMNGTVLILFCASVHQFQFVVVYRTDIWLQFEFHIPFLNKNSSK